MVSLMFLNVCQNFLARGKRELAVFLNFSESDKAISDVLTRGRGGGGGGVGLF